MKKRTSQFALLILASSLFFLQSCIDETYDLTQENVSLEVSVGGENLAIPIGSTDSILLGDIVGENDLIGLNEDSVYSISMSSSIDPISLTIDPISLNIGSVNIDPLSLEFGSTSVPDFSIPQITSSSQFDIPATSVSDISLPTIQTTYSYAKTLPAPISIAGIPVNETISFDGDPIAVGFNYDLASNDEVKLINLVYLGSDENGDRFSLLVDVSAIASKLDPVSTTMSINDFHMVFPSNFAIAKDETAAIAASSTITGSTFTLSNYTIPNGTTTVDIAFYIQSLNLQEYTDNIDFNKTITYGLEISVDGTSNGETINSLDVGVSTDNALSMNYADVTTNDLAIDSDISGSFNISTSIGGLADLKSVDLIEYEPTSIMVVQISNLSLPLSFSAGEMVINFPALFNFDKDLSEIGDATLSTDNALTIPAGSLFGSTISLVIKTMDLSDKTIVDGTLTIDEAISYAASNLTLGGERIETTALDGLGTQNIDITVPEIEMSITSATVTTNSIVADVEQSSVFELDEEVPNEIQAIQSISLTENASIEISINFEGVPSGLGNLTFDNFEIALPSFIQFAPSDNIVDGVLSLNEQFDATTGFSKTLTITGIDFTGPFGATGVSTQDVGGKNMLTINSNNAITLKGGVKTAESTLSSDDLDGLTITPSVSIQPLTVGKVVGTFDPQIDPIDQTVALDLGGLTFMEQANIKFNNPQILLTINSNIGIPVDLSLALQGTDADGNLIEGSKIDEITLGLKAAEVVGETTASKFILSEQGSQLDGYEPVKIEGISNLLQTLPDMISFQMNAASDKTQTHTIDLSKDLTISGDYEIKVPLEFDEFEINYDTIISGLGDSLQSVFDLVGNTDIEIHATFENSIPLAFNIQIAPINAAGDTLTDIEAYISDTIAAGDGINPAEEDLIIKFNPENDAIYELDGFSVHLNVTANSTVGGAALREDQYLRIKDMMILIKDGLNFDINDLTGSEN